MLLSVIDFNKSLTGVRRVEKMLYWFTEFASSRSLPFHFFGQLIFASAILSLRVTLGERGERWLEVRFMALFLDTVSLCLRRRMGENSSNKTVTLRNPTQHQLTSTQSVLFTNSTSPLKHPIHFPLLAVLVFSSFFFRPRFP